MLQQLSPPEIDAVLAHELGHYKRRHIVQRVVLMFALSLVGFALLGWLSNQIWFYTGLGVTPALETDQGVITQNAAILAFVAQTHPDRNLAPIDDPHAFARAHRDFGYSAAYVPASLIGADGATLAEWEKAFSEQDVTLAEVGIGEGESGIPLVDIA